MLKLPVCGFAKRADDTVARAMAILKNKPDYTAKPSNTAPEGRSRDQSAR
ncbi:hypothetical protein [Microvirga vignae]|nr:hypothetical protein [Microvirga vignae]